MEFIIIIIIIIIYLLKQTNPFKFRNACNLMRLWLPDTQEERYLSNYQVVRCEGCLQSFDLSHIYMRFHTQTTSHLCRFGDDFSREL